MKKPKILDLRPSQLVLGMREVDFKIKKMSGFNTKQLNAYCDDHVIPVVLGPKKEKFIIDHHHFARACWELNVDCYSVKLIEDLSDKSLNRFWQEMIKRGWTYLHDQFGAGPHAPLSLPVDIRCMADDPYRSLVWALINQGYIQKHPQPFFEFQWTEYYRNKLPIDLHSKSDFSRAINYAGKLARSNSARKLPGFCS